MTINDKMKLGTKCRLQYTVLYIKSPVVQELLTIGAQASES